MPVFSARGVSRSRSHGGRRTVASALLALSGLTATACTNTSEPVVFGVVGPFQESYGASMRLGAEFAMEEINAAGGIRGRQLELSALDDEASPQRAPAIAGQFFDDPQVVAVVGHVNSGTTIAAAPVYNQGLPAVATTATSPAIAQLGPWIFRIASSDSANSVVLARRARELSQARTAILYENEDYGRGLLHSFRTVFAATGGSILEADPYLVTTQDFTPYLERLRRQNAELIFVAGLEAGAARMISQARALGMDARFLGGDGLEGLVSMGPMYDGTLVGLLYHPDASAEARSFADRFRAEYGRNPDSFAALAYDAVMLLARATEEAGADRQAIREYLAGVGRPGGSPPFEGVSGTLRFDENGDPIDKEFAIGVIRDGSIVLGSGE